MTEDINLIQRYARALYQIATSNGKVLEVTNNLGIIAQLLVALPQQFAYLSAPITAFSLRQSVVRVFADKYKFHKITANFLLMLCYNRRLGWLSLVLQQFEKLHKQAQGVLDVEIRATAKLTDKQVKGIKSYLDKLLNKESELNMIVDPNLLGGLIIRIGSVEVDNSVANRLNRIRFNSRDFYQ